MNKTDFILELNEKLSFLPWEDAEERLAFYREMIEDRMEEGLSEEEAVAAVGSVDEIVSQILADTPLSKLAKERIKSKRRLNVLEILLLVLGFPIWLSLGIAAVAVIFSVYVSLWSVIISLWAVFASLAACAVGGTLACVIFAVGGNVPTGLAMLAAGIVCTGLSIFIFLGCKAVSKGILILTKKFALWVKSCFIKKEEA